MHLSLVAGPLRLLDGDFPEREGMLGIVEYNLRKVLAWGTESQAAARRGGRWPGGWYG
jgi:hypothetical protein